MKKTILFTLFVFLLSGLVYSQSANSSINVGDVFLIGKTDNNYKYINFPKANFIIKKGGIVSYKNIVGEKVTITSIKEKEDGKLVGTIQLTSKKWFFNSHKYVTVAINEAIDNKELLRI